MEMMEMKAIYLAIALALFSTVAIAGSSCYFIGDELFCNGKKCVKVGDQFLGC